jgi:hypothetical protein
MSDELFEFKPQEPIVKMSQKEFVEKTKAVLNKICDSYSQGWQSRVLRNGEYPDESVCDKCKGNGIFIVNGEERECVRDDEQGDCFRRFCDYEEVGMSLENYLDDVFDLLSVNEIITEEK